MPLPGGPADKFGNSYEGLWTVNSMIEIISGLALSICIEPLGPEGEGMEFWLQRRVDKREYHQVKRQYGKDGCWTLAVLNSKKVLAHFRKKLCEDQEAYCVFVSMHAAYQLDELADRARRSGSWQKFHEACLNTEGWVQDFETLCTYWNGCSQEEAYEALKRIEVETAGENHLRRTVECHLDLLVERDPAHSREGDAATARDILAQFAIESVHLTLTAYDIWLRLEERGYRRRDWGNDPDVVARAKNVTKRYVTQLRTTLIAGKVIHRSEVDTILQALVASNDQHGFLLSAEAGAGKSGVILQVVEGIRKRGWPVLAFRIDRLDPVLDPEDIGRQLKLPGSPVNVLAAIAQGRDCVLVIDQIDAVSTTSGRNPQFFDCIEILIEQAQTHPRMHLLLACRKFDLENDSRLRRLVGKGGIATPLPIIPLDQTIIKRVVQELGLDASLLTQKQILLLSNPFHLSLLAGVAQNSSTTALSFQTAKDLYYQFWDAKEAAVTQRLGYPVPWPQIMDALANGMSRQQRLFVTEAVMDQFNRSIVKAMVSEHVLVQHAGQYAFFHESFFDYVFARRFAAQGHALVPFLCETEQHLFRRAQVRQILLHERDVDRDRYLNDLRELLTSSTIRFHIKQIALALLAGFADPTEEEWTILAPLLENTADPCSQEIWRKLQYSASWFHLLDTLGLIEQWLAIRNDQRIEQTLLLLAHAQGQLPDRVAELVEPFLDDEAWRTRFLFLIRQSDLSAGRRFFNLFLRCIEKGWLDETEEALVSNHSLFWTVLFALPAQRPEWACEAIGRYFDRCLNRSILVGERHPFDHRLNIVPHTFHGNNTLMESATHAPLAFYQQVSDFMYMVMGLNVRREGSPPWQDSVWGRMQRHSGGDYGANALLSAMERALSRIAADHPEQFEPIALLLQALNFETAHYLLLRGYTANGVRFADAAAEYLCKPTTDLAIGYGGDAHGVTRELIEAITPHCSEQAFAHLEQCLLNYYTAYERSAKSYRTRVFFGQPTLFGHPQLELLEGVASFRRTRAIQRRIAEWRRKFPDTARRSPQSHPAVFSASRIGSPISRGATAKMTDKQWLRAIARHHHDHPHMHRDGTLVGGVFHIASQLESLVKEQPHRFATLVQIFPDDTHPSYFDAVLRGIAEAPLDRQTVLDVCWRCHSLPDRPCGHGICTMIANKAEFPLLPETLDIVAWYATEGVQSDQDEWRDSLDESLDRHTDPITAAGSMSVRGNAAEAIAHLIYHDGERIPFFLPTLSRTVGDESIPVRACVALALRAVLKYDREMALSLFSQLCETEDVLLQSSSVEEFLAPVLHTHFGAVEPLLQRMLQSAVSGVTRVGARLACVASLVTEQARPLAELCLCGSEAQRIGAAEIFTLHLRLAPFRAFCEQALIQLFNDPVEKVRESAATCFNEFEGGQLGEYRELIEAFVQSRTFVTNPYYFIHALENTSAKLPEITCLACETLFETMRERNFNGYAHVRPDIVGKLLLRVYNQQRDKALQRRCLNLIDRMLQLGEYSLSQVLVEYER